MQTLRVISLLLICAIPVFGQTYESHSTPCIETAPLGLWSPWVEFNESKYTGQWFVAPGPLGGSCSSGGGFFQAGSVLESGQPVDLRELGVGNHYVTAILEPVSSSNKEIRKVWNVQVADPGDVDGDGTVGFADFIVLSRSYGIESGRHLGDLDYSGVVGFGDFVILSRNYGTLSSRASNRTESVPEPSALVIALGLLVTLALFRRR